ncbi:MAG: elongation factor P maturation arginine rhamnosyltransferase EarP [Nitrosomonas sp.]|nr:elongation factor P maturation arginine rhamnosyltransferase EarP [Nitrosomonas sp.]
MREKNLMVQREAFTTTAEHAFLQRKRLLEYKSGEIRISMFCYDTAPVIKFIQVLSKSSVPISIINCSTRECG